MSFDGEVIFVGDVEPSTFEEEKLVERGGNYGWNIKEGARCLAVKECPDETPESVRGGEPLVVPIVEHSHVEGPITGNSVIGGYVYRGDRSRRERDQLVVSGKDPSPRSVRFRTGPEETFHARTNDRTTNYGTTSPRRLSTQCSRLLLRRSPETGSKSSSSDDR